MKSMETTERPIEVKKEARDKIIMLRCTKEHHRLLKAEAKARDYKLSTWVLYAALNFKPAPKD